MGAESSSSSSPQPPSSLSQPSSSSSQLDSFGLPPAFAQIDARFPHLHTWVWQVNSVAMDTVGSPPATPEKQDPNEIVPWTTPDKASPPQLRYYSGVTAVRSGYGQLSVFHTLGNDCTVRHNKPDIGPICEQEGGLKKLKTLMQSGLAAVCLVIPKLSTGFASRLSGFRLRRDGVDVVVTSAHFTEWPTSQHDFDEEAQKYASMENGMVIALQTPDAGEENVQDYNDDEKLNLQLIAAHRPWDLAIFRVIGRSEDDETNQVIDWNQMHFVTQEDRGKLDSKDFWWSVGYNLNNDLAKFQSTWRKFFTRQPSDIQADIRLLSKFDGANPPKLDFLKVNQRSVSFGSLDAFAPTGFSPKPYQVSLNLSAWYGRSGSMVCTREKGGVDGKESQVYVYGVIMGGSDKSNYNVMNMFTEEMKGWFEKAFDFHPDEEEHPVDFSQRFVMTMDEDTVMSDE